MGSLAKNRFLWIVVLLALGAAFWGTLQVASAHNIGWKWDTSDDPVVSNLNTPYNSKIMSAKRDYDNNTDLSVDSCNQPCTESILHVYQYFSGVDWAAAADSYSGGLQCQVDIVCNETNKKVDYGVVVWNSAVTGYSGSYAHYLARHEMGHIFGLRHAPCHTRGRQWRRGVLQRDGRQLPLRCNGRTTNPRH